MEHLKLTPPESLESFHALRRELPGILEGIQSREKANVPARRKATLEAGEAAKRHREKATERDALRATGSLIPVKARERRDVIARGAEADPSDLPSPQN